MTKLIGKLRNKLLAGIAVAVPLLATIWILTLGYNVVKGISTPWVKRMGIEWPGIDFLISVVLLIGLGFMATHVIGRQLLAGFERLLMRMPIVATIYGAMKQVIDSLRSFGASPNFKRVVWVAYPVDGYRLLAFATGQFTEPGTGRRMVSVFIPTAPNPVTGFVLAVDESQVIDAEIPMEDATKFIISAGLVPPYGETAAEPMEVAPLPPASAPTPPTPPAGV